jgi:formylglycine-generating enzyme required for sulfatase activity
MTTHGLRRWWAIAPAMLIACWPAERAPETWVEPVTGMEFVLLSAGRFEMGSPVDEPGHEAQELRHRVELSRPFWLGRHEVTQRQWRTVMGTEPSRFEGDDRLPVEQVNAIEVDEFLRRLGTGAPGESFRLPSEAEWEYACRAGTTTAYSTGPTLSTDQANYDGRYPARGQDVGRYRAGTTPVGSFPANRWGLFDLHGNVWEWTADKQCPYPAGPAVDPVVRCESALRVIRGGSWTFNADSSRCAVRYTHRPVDRGPSLGFRVVREDGTDRLP